MEKVLMIVAFLGAISCTGGDELVAIKKEFNEKSKISIEKHLGKNKFSKSYIDYVKDNTSITVLKNNTEESIVEVEVKTISEKLSSGAVMFAISKDRDKFTVSDMLSHAKIKGLKVNELKPKIVKTTCTFESNKKLKLKTCGF